MVFRMIYPLKKKLFFVGEWNLCVGGRAGRIRTRDKSKNLAKPPQKDKWQQREHQEMILIICHYERYESAAFLVLISECVVWTWKGKRGSRYICSKEWVITLHLADPDLEICGTSGSSFDGTSKAKANHVAPLQQMIERRSMARKCEI